jgi:hypothetical protein
MKGNRRYIQGYNAQAVVNEQQIVLAADRGKKLYGKRQQSSEPVFGHTKHNRQFQWFTAAGRQSGPSGD